MQDASNSTPALPSAAAVLPDPEQGSDSGEQPSEVQHMALNKIRAQLKVRNLANTWRRRASDKALPGLRPFIPRLLRQEMLAMAQWYRVNSLWHGLLLQSSCQNRLLDGMVGLHGCLKLPGLSETRLCMWYMTCQHVTELVQVYHNVQLTGGARARR